jgi:hypothetical protein|tara:strand:+ start:369 stop:542 length:174 start_codon:yes stop_codon:yes gene_type:complete
MAAYSLQKAENTTKGKRQKIQYKRQDTKTQIEPNNCNGQLAPWTCGEQTDGDIGLTA